MFAAVTSAALVGVEPRQVRVEAHVSGGKELFSVVGLPDASVREARARVRSAIAASGHRFPGQRVTVNLAPADLPKVGSAYDLPIALGVLVAAGDISPAASRVVALGELALDGAVRPARGGLAAGLVAKRRGERCLVGADGSGEAALSGADVRGVATRFVETFHDDGKTDMFAAMKAYDDAGFDGPMRPDHVPEMEGDPTDRPGYTVTGRIFAIGYMKGIMDAVDSVKGRAKQAR